MAVAFDANSVAVTHAVGAGNGNVTIAAGNANNITIGSGTNRAVVFLIANAGSAAQTISSVTWDSAGGSPQSASFIGGVSHADGGGNNMRVELWGLVAPHSGNLGLHVVSTDTSDVYIYAVSYTGVDQTGGATSFAHVTTGSGGTLGADTAATLSVPSATNDAVVATWIATDVVWTSANNTQLYVDNSGGIGVGIANRAAGAASVTMTASPNNAWAGAGVDVVAAGGGAAIKQSLIEISQAIGRASYW